MATPLLWIGRATGTAGAFLSFLAGAMRASGQYYLGGIQLTTVLMAGMAAMILGCLCLLLVLSAGSTNKQRRDL